MGFYLEQITDLYDQLADLGASYWCRQLSVGFYAKQKVFNAVADLGGDLITRLHPDANLRQATAIYTGPRKKDPGAPNSTTAKLTEKIPESVPSGSKMAIRDCLGRLPDQPPVRILTTVANSPPFGRDLWVVLLIGPDGEQVVLASTNAGQHAEESRKPSGYRLRYQIEFVIRDAKQHTGLPHCQARSQEKLDFHLNMSVAAVNLLRLLETALGGCAGEEPRSEVGSC